MKFHFFKRRSDGENPAGLTVSKHAHLPDGDFKLTEYCWGSISLWFIDRDEFTADERETCREKFKVTERELPLKCADCGIPIDAPELCKGCYTGLCTACFSVGRGLCEGCRELEETD